MTTTNSNRIATCIGCGCDDNHACVDGLESACWWVRLDREEGLGVCSACPSEHVEAWDRGDRTSRAVPVEIRENPPRIPRPEQPRPASVVPHSGVCREIAGAGVTIRFAPKHGVCPHDWPFEDVEDRDCCRWCGMSFLHHLFTEFPE